MPNWVDIFVVVIPSLLACYSGFSRGAAKEFFSLAGTVSATALACNYYPVLAQAVAPWLRFDVGLLNFLSFVGLLLLGMALLVRVVARTLAQVITWESANWISQGLGMVFGGIRGLWWAALALLLLLATGVPWLIRSVEERSITGPRLVRLGQVSIEWVADRYPGHAHRQVLIPSIQ